MVFYHIWGHTTSLYDLLQHQTQLSDFYTIGILTSIWNHGTKSEVTTWADRSCACMAIFVNLYYVCTLEKQMAISGSLILITKVNF
jgi:hypothetical protein